MRSRNNKYFAYNKSQIDTDEIENGRFAKIVIYPRNSHERINLLLNIHS